MSSPRPTLDLAAHDPHALDHCDRETLTTLLMQVSAVQSAIAARLIALPSPPPEPQAGNGAGPAEKLLTIEKAALRISRSPKWLYRRSKTLPFVIRLGRNVLVSEQKLERWIERQGRRT